MKSKVSKLHTILIAGLLAISSCGNADNSKTETTIDSMKASADTAVDNIKKGAQNMADKVNDALTKDTDSDFVVKAALTNNAELKVLQAGLERGTDKELKSHAKMMMADHKAMGAKVKDYASKKGYVLPQGDDGKSDDVLGKLNNNSKGKDWDKAWAEHMVSAHEDAVSMFENEEKNAKDNELKNIVSGALPTLRSHLDMMKALKDKLSR